jgi:hypothetical protein
MEGKNERQTCNVDRAGDPVLQREKLEKERKIIEAQGEAEAIRLKGQVLATNPALIQYEYVQKITPGIQTIITDGKSILSLGDIVKK